MSIPTRYNPLLCTCICNSSDFRRILILSIGHCLRFRLAGVKIQCYLILVLAVIRVYLFLFSFTVIRFLRLSVSYIKYKLNHIWLVVRTALKRDDSQTIPTCVRRS